MVSKRIVERLGQLEIDVDKDWRGRLIKNLGAPLDAGDAARKIDIDAHKTATPLDHPDGSVTTAKIADGAVTTAKIASGAVTFAKCASEIVTHASRHRPGGADPLFPASFNIEPAVDNAYDFGSPSYRWRAIHVVTVYGALISLD